MQRSAVAKILAEIEALSTEEQAELRATISTNGSSAGTNGRVGIDDVPSVYVVKRESNPAFDFTLSRQWLEAHGTKYLGQYIALDGDRLIAHGADGSIVAMAVRESGVKSFFFTLIPPADALPYVGF